MGMRRTARQHDTTGVQRHEAFRSAEHWEHQPNDRVITVDGPGRVVAVHDGPFPGAEEYEIRLEGGLGGGTYGPGQITASSPAQASVGTSEATGQHLASDDYPELGTLLFDRPDPASLRYTAELASGGTPMTTHDSPAADGGLGDADEGQIMWAPEYNNNLYHDWSLASRTGVRAFDDYHPGQVYLRFGSWPENERSQNNVTGYPEEGVSVYDLDHNGDPMDPDPGMDRGRHEHDEYCGEDCDLPEFDEDYGNDTGQEMRDRTHRAQRARNQGVSSSHPDVGHLVKGDMVGIGHDGEPLLKNVRRVGDWIDHRHLFVPGAPKHELARDEDDEDYEPPEEQPTHHTARSINGEHIDNHGSAPGWHRAANPNEYDRQSTEGEPDPAWIDDIDERQQAMAVRKTAAGSEYVGEHKEITDPEELADHLHRHHGWGWNQLPDDDDELEEMHDDEHETWPVGNGHHHGNINPDDHWCEVHQEYHDDPKEAEDHLYNGGNTDWDEHVWDLPDEIHRGMNIQLPKAVHDIVHDESRPESERAQHLLHHLKGGMGIGMHWSTDEDSAKSFAESSYDKDGKTRVLMTAETPDREHFETDPAKLDGAFHFSHEESEIPLQRGTPLKLKSISWSDRPEIDFKARQEHPHEPAKWFHHYNHHDFEEPEELPVQEPLFHATASSLPSVIAHDDHENLGPVPSDRERLRQHMITDHGYSPDQLSDLPDPGQGDALEAEHELEHDELHDEGVGGGEFGSGEHIGMPHVHKEHQPEQRGGYAPFPDLPQSYHPAWGGSAAPDPAERLLNSVPAEADTELPLHALSMLATAAQDPGFRFHVTAAWRDVQAKAKRIRSQGGVSIKHSDGMTVVADVKGDHNVYETALQRAPGRRQSVAVYACGCKWGAYHWGASDDLSRFAGRMCSHALALQYEAASRGMFGRDVEVDDARPRWVPSKVVVKYDIDTGRNLRATAKPEGVTLYRGLHFGEISPEQVAAFHRDPAAFLQDQMGANNAGTHWTDNHQVAANFAMSRDVEGYPFGDEDEGHSHGVVLHAQVHPRHIIEEGTPEWDDHAAFGGAFGHDSAEEEIGVRPGAPIHITHLTALSHDPDTHADRVTTHPWGLQATASRTVPEQPPVLVALMGMKDGDPAALAVLAAVNDLFGDTGYGNEPSLMSPMGPTVPWDHNESPASAGPLKAPEADNWGSISGSDMLPRLASVITTEAFWQRLAVGAGAAAGVAEMGETAAAPELAAAKMIPEAVNKVTDKIEQVEDPERIERANEGVQATLHDEPEPALPVTDGEEHTASMGDVDLVGGSGIGGAGETLTMGNEDLSPEDPSIQTQGSSSIVAEFQRSAAAQSLMNSGSKGDTSTADIARAAEEFLAKKTAASFTRAEQDALIHESPGVQASNTDRLDIEGTHYAELERMDTPEEDTLWWI